MSGSGALAPHGPWAIAAGRLRATWWRLRGARVAAKAWVGRDVRSNRAQALCLGERATIEEGVRVVLVDRAAALELGAHAFVGAGCRFDLAARLVVGAHSLLGPGCFLTDHNHGLEPMRRIDEQPCRTEQVAIGSDVWLGAHVIVLPGVAIGDGAVVAAGAVVTVSVAPGAIVAGVPARVVGRREDRARGQP